MKIEGSSPQGLPRVARLKSSNPSVLARQSSLGGCNFRVGENRRHFRGLAWRAPVSARYFPISVSAWRRPVRFFTETGSYGVHRGRASEIVASDCAALHSPWIFATVVVIEPGDCGIRFFSSQAFVAEPRSTGGRHHAGEPWGPPRGLIHNICNRENVDLVFTAGDGADRYTVATVGSERVGEGRPPAAPIVRARLPCRGKH